MFFLLNNLRPQDRPSFTRPPVCLSCHLSYNSLDVPGLLDRSMFTAPNGATLPQLGSFLVDHHTPLRERWGGYYVTGTHGDMRHMGNAVVTDREHPDSMVTSETLNVTSLDGKVDLKVSSLWLIPSRDGQPFFVAGSCSPLKRPIASS